MSMSSREGQEQRAKYTQKQIDALGAKGQAFKNPDGHYSYPIADAEDLSNAIHAVGRGGADHNKIRAYVIGRAKALGKLSEIPDNWNSDGSLKTANSADVNSEDRDAPTPEDWGVMQALKDANLAIAHAKAKQLADPDYKTDPDDQAVMDAIQVAASAVDKAIVAQSKDGHDDADTTPARSLNPATPKRAFSSMVEQAPAQTAQVQMRVAEDDTTARFAGYASTTGVPYSVRDWLGEYQETIMPGAFAKTLREQGNIPLLFNHDGVPIASTSSGTSRLSEDARGLHNEADLDRRDALTNSLCVQLQRGVLDKMSFSFKAHKDAWNDNYDDRSVSEAQLFDTSIVTYPANPTTSAELVTGMRSALGREGRSLWLASDELSVRSTLPLLGNAVGGEVDDLLERAVRALVHADDVMSRSNGAHGRARTFGVVRVLLEARAGKVLSAANQALLQQALDALSAGDQAHQKLAAQHDKAKGNLQSVLSSSSAAKSSDDDGMSNGTPPGQGNPIMPQDGAGPRSQKLSAARRLARQRESELRALRRR